MKLIKPSKLIKELNRLGEYPYIKQYRLITKEDLIKVIEASIVDYPYLNDTTANIPIRSS